MIERTYTCTGKSTAYRIEGDRISSEDDGAITGKITGLGDSLRLYAPSSTSIPLPARWWPFVPFYCVTLELRTSR